MVPPGIAAIVPVYNRPRLVLEALDSVAAQTRPPDRVVVVDDGSTDVTPERLADWARSQEGRLEVRVIRQENRGVSAARNRGVLAAGDVEWLACLDSDDLWPPDYLERMARVLGESAAIVAATCDRLDLGGSGGRKLRRFDRLPDATTRRLFVGGSPGTPNTVFRADAFRRAGGYDETQPTLEDYQLLLRLSCLGRWGYAPGRPVVVRRDPPEGRGDAIHLSRRDPGWRRRQAGILERFIRSEGGGDAIPERFWKPRLAHIWYKAGRQLEKSGRANEAMDCFGRALALAPGHVRARFRRALAGRSARRV